MKWYIYESFAVQKYMRMHPFCFMAMVTGGGSVQSIKLKLNTKSSTESKFSGVYDVLNQVI